MTMWIVASLVWLFNIALWTHKAHARRARKRLSPMDRRRALHARINAEERALDIVETVWDDPEPVPSVLRVERQPRPYIGDRPIPKPYVKPLRPQEPHHVSGVVCATVNPVPPAYWGGIFIRDCSFVPPAVYYQYGDQRHYLTGGGGGGGSVVMLPPGPDPGQRALF